jgi:8-oxo-dGTP pyrophosphatase MutT (NUDIX family)
MKRTIKRLLLPYAYGLLTVYWRFFSPETHGVKGLVWCGDRILLVKHSYGDTRYKIPGGLRSRAEQPHQTILRELNEELSISIERATQIGTYKTNDEYKTDNITVFSVSLDSCDVEIDGAEIVHAEWFSPEQLPESRHEQVDRMLNMYNEFHVSKR